MDAAASLCALSVALVLSACSGDDSSKQGGDAPPVADTSETLPEGVTALLEDSWMYLVAADPSRLAPFERGTTGDAWLAFFHNDLQGALRSFGSACTPSGADLSSRSASGYPCVGLARTHLELARLFDIAFQVDVVAMRQFYQHRKTHPEDVLASVHESFFYGVVLLHVGDRAAGKTQLQAYLEAEGRDESLAALAQRIVHGLEGGDSLVARLWGGASEDAGSGEGFDTLPVSSAVSAYRLRLDLAAAVARGDALRAKSLIRPISMQTPDLTEQLQQRPGGGDLNTITPELAHHDPIYLQALSRMHAQLALAALGESQDLKVLGVEAARWLGREAPAPTSVPGLDVGLALVLFSDSPRPGDLAVGASGSESRTLSRLAPVLPTLGASPSRSLAELDPFVTVSNSVRRALTNRIKASGPDGANMDADMGLSERFRGRLLRERAEQFRASFAVHMGADLAADAETAGIACRTLLEMALDKNPSPPNPQLKKARISFRNDPAFLADLARSQLDTRHPYDANEYIRPLTEVYGELVPVREALAALDSAWNPARRGSVR